MTILTSSNEYIRLGEPAILRTPLTIDGKNVHLFIACTRYSERLLDKLRNKLSGEAYYSLINIELASQAGLRALITAHLESYLAAKRGATISKVRGIDTILYILCTRNIREALKANKLEEGATIVLVAASPSTTLLQELRSMISGDTVECKIPVTGSIGLSGVALFPIEARVYKSIPA